MAIKVFCQPAQVIGYIADPPNTFEIHVGYTVFDSPSLSSHDSAATLQIPIGTTPYAIYQQVYNHILGTCISLGVEAPSKNDVMGYVPTPFAVMLPDLPTFA